MGFCIVCNAVGDTSGLYRLPKSREKRKIWIENLKMSKYYVDTEKDVRVCFRHFRDTNYKLTATYLRLKPGMQ